MIILSIETSCDDTGISIIKKTTNKKKKVIDFNDFEILSESVSSQATIHSPYGGVFPSLAKREHQKNLVPLLISCLKTAKLLKPNKKSVDNKKVLRVKKLLEKNPDLFQSIKLVFEKYSQPEINKVAVTTGPGLEPCLWTGINLARAISLYWNIPLVSINHLEGHILSSYLSPIEKIEFPATALVVSGGNTQLIQMQEIGKYKTIGQTKDDAAGECFDKTARILSLGYPGGPKIRKEASNYKKDKFNITLPRPMIHEKNYDFSFSGLKTAVLYDFKKRNQKEQKSKEYIEEMCFKIEKAIIDVLVHKTIKASLNNNSKSIILGGGVSANKELIKELKKQCKINKINFIYPNVKYAGDNASMIGITALFSLNAKKATYQRIKANSNFKING
jgi:N6-L-threonylcarbamoyladenine synthase